MKKLAFLGEGFIIRNPLLLPYVAICAFFALGAQLTTEYFGICGDGDDLFAWSDQRWLLAGMALCLIVVASYIGHHRKKQSRIRADIRALPFEARGAWFNALTIGLCGAFGFLGHVGEHARGLPGHDGPSWLLAGALVAVIGSALARSFIRAVPKLVSVLASFLVRSTLRIVIVPRFTANFAANAFSCAWFPHLYNRPPPLLRAC